MSSITRISISLASDVLEKFDALSKEQGFPTRSEAITHLIHSSLVQQQWADGKVVAGAITLIYDHHKSQILQKIVDVQHDFGNLVICSQHAHLDRHNCMENIIVRGEMRQIQKLHQGLSAVKGMKHAVLSMTTTGKDL
ncbi:MAG: nickel-responsive transcriptional regulator NikR [Planctomycetaceae bacterium]|jgi:CopG family nickel-responsive transcriptional regulator|nr:nickel-responsive transcriptional regulator NikR [Planctomycetaceae bacterium]